MRVSIRKHQGGENPRINFSLTSVERDYLFKNAEKISNKVIFFTRNSELFIRRAEVGEEGALALTKNTSQNKNYIYYAFNITFKHYAHWKIGALTECASHKVEEKQLLINGVPHYVVPIRMLYMDLPEKVSVKAAALEQPKLKQCTAEPLYRPQEHPPSPVRKITPPAAPQNVTLNDLKSAIDLCNNYARECGAELFVEENKLRAKIMTIL
jgi:hypothetical protein